MLDMLMKKKRRKHLTRKQWYLSALIQCWVFQKQRELAALKQWWSLLEVMIGVLCSWMKFKLFQQRILDRSMKMLKLIVSLG